MYRPLRVSASSAPKYRCFRWPRSFRYKADKPRFKGVLPRGFNLWLTLLLVLVCPALPALAANPQLVKGGSAVTITMTGGSGGSGTPPGSAYQFSIWEGSTQVVPNTSVSSLPVTVNGVTCSAAPANNSNGALSSITLQASSSSSVPNFTGAYVQAQGPAQACYGAVDVSGAAAASPTVSNFAASPNSVSSTVTETWTVTLSAAPSAAVSVPVSLSSSTGTFQLAGATPPASITVAAGATTGSASFQFGCSSGSGTVSYTATYGGASQILTVSVSAPASGTTGSTGTTSSTGAAGAPGVSASVSPFVIAPGGSSVLRWDTSGASSVAVTGVSNPSASGTINVSPTQTTTYTITATNSSGTNTQQVTLTVDSVNGVGAAGASSFTPGTTVSSAGGSYTAPTLPGLSIAGTTIPGVSVPGFPTLPPLTIPGVTLPPISLPGVTLPGVSAPGDLKIGIPGLGSIGIPTGWLTQVIAAAINPSSIAQQLATFQSAQFNALATYNAGAAVTNAVNNGTATLQQINTSTSQQQIGAINSTSAATQSAINTTAQVTQATISTTASQTQGTINTNFTSMLTAGPSGLLTQLFQYLFIPDQATLQSLSATSQTFLNWGPYQFITSSQAIFAPSTATQAPVPVSGGPLLPFARQAPRVETGARANLSRPLVAGQTPQNIGSAAPVPVYGVPLPPAGTDLAIPLMTPSYTNTYTYDPVNGLTQSASSVWVNTGQSVAFDFTPITNAKFWPFFRTLEGASVYLVFLMGVVKRLFPKQVL